MRLILFLFLLGFLLAANPASAEVWHHPSTSQTVAPCSRLPDATIDDLWNRLEETREASLEVVREHNLANGVVFKDPVSGSEFQFYRTQQSCEYQRREVLTYLEEGPEALKRLRSTVPRSEWLRAVTPSSVAEENRESWINSFGGCTDGTLGQLDDLRGSLENTLVLCDCVAGYASTSEMESLNDDEVQAFSLSTFEACLTELDP